VFSIKKLNDAEINNQELSNKSFPVDELHLDILIMMNWK
jgi:hypothetical protein